MLIFGYGCSTLKTHVITQLPWRCFQTSQGPVETFMPRVLNYTRSVSIRSELHSNPIDDRLRIVSAVNVCYIKGAFENILKFHLSGKN